MSEEKQIKYRLKIAAIILVVLLVLLFSLRGLLAAAGEFLVVNESPQAADAVVVLSTGIEYYPRLMEAAALYSQGHVKKIVINGDRKTTALRKLEDMGFRRCCPWYENSVRILTVLGVPRESILPIAAEDAYDTVSEAQAVGPALIAADMKKILITTSKFHTRRARYIWRQLFGDQLIITMVAARDDPYSPDHWWIEGRQVRWVLAEYGAWLYYFWKR